MKLRDEYPETPLMIAPEGKFSRIMALLGAERVLAQQHKIGGEPDWIHGDDTPECCDQPMTFYGQLASLGGGCDLIDNGIIYVFLCPKCCSSRSVFQFS